MRLHTHAYTNAVNWTLAFHSEYLWLSTSPDHALHTSFLLCIYTTPPSSSDVSYSLSLILHPTSYTESISRSSLLSPAGVNAVMLNEMVHWSGPHLRRGCGAEKQGKKDQLPPTRSTAGSTFMNAHTQSIFAACWHTFVTENP